MLLPYFLLGSAFGVVIVEAEVVSWFRIQEMFRFDAFHMYGIIGTAVLTAAISLLTIKRLGLRGPDGTPLGLAPKRLGTGVQYLAGGTMFGLGWALTGACPGPLVALVGAGTPVMLVAILSALVGTWTYGQLRPRLPH
ncbi:MAG: transporter [Acidobacteria bacterium]|nr:MAG: transporter [Acidobacteriota bacterium]PYR51823.1 MAG: transporter [Acidobacteriota bacterium]